MTTIHTSKSKVAVTGAFGYSGSYITQRLLDHGDATEVGDLLAAGSEDAVASRLRAYGDAGATDVNVRVVPIGDTRDQLIASRDRTRSFLASLGGAL